MSLDASHINHVWDKVGLPPPPHAPAPYPYPFPFPLPYPCPCPCPYPFYRMAWSTDVGYRGKT